MSDVKAYCDKNYKRLIGIKAGLYDVIGKAEKMSDQAHADELKQLKSLVESVEKGLEELSGQCPPDWTPNKKEVDDTMANLSETLNKAAERLNVSVPDTTAWI